MIPCKISQVILKFDYVDFRKGLNGLLGECYSHNLDPYSGQCVVFIKRDKTQLRALTGDEFGLFLITRRFEKGRLTIPWINVPDEKKRQISHAELSMLFEGAHFVVKKRATKWK